MRNLLSYIIPEWYWILLAVGGLYALGNMLAHYLRGDTRHVGLWIHYFGTGFIAGAALSTIWLLFSFIPYVGQVFQNIGLIYVITHLTLGIGGMLLGVFNHGWKGVKQGFKLCLGLAYLDENRTISGIVNGILRHTWELPQTAVGHALSQIRNTSSWVSRVDFYGGDTFAINDNQPYQDGISLGNYLNINLWYPIHEDFDEHIKHTPLLLHEFGHSFDSRIFGWLYLPIIGLPSLHNAMGNGDHSKFWTEIRANRMAKSYAEKHRGVSWGNFEDEYPTA